MIKLFETYKSQKELETLTSDILKAISDATYKYHMEKIWADPSDEKYGMHGKSYFIKFKDGIEMENGIYVVNYFEKGKLRLMGFDEDEYVFDLKTDIESMEFSDVNKRKFKRLSSQRFKYYRFDMWKYDVLKPMLNECTIMVSMEHKVGNSNANGVYTKRGSIDFITIYYDKNKFTQLFKGHEMISSTQIYMDVYNEFNSVLLHELQHMYDAYRSGWKSFNKQTNDSDYSGQQDKSKDISKREREGDELSTEEIEFRDMVSRKYLNFPHEINARFSQAIKKTRFYDLKTDIVDSKIEIKHVMFPLLKVIEDFKYNFTYLGTLSSKDKRKLYRKVSQFYYLEKESLIKKGYKVE